MRILSVLLFFTICFGAHAQLLQNLKKQAADKAKGLATKENLDKAGDFALKGMEDARASFDSADFDYAILLSDNSGLFDVREKGETSANISSALNIGLSGVKNAEWSDEERARMNRQSGEVLYGYHKFNMAEK